MLAIGSATAAARFLGRGEGGMGGIWDKERRGCGEMPGVEALEGLIGDMGGMNRESGDGVGLGRDSWERSDSGGDEEHWLKLLYRSL